MDMKVTLYCVECTPDDKIWGIWGVSHLFEALVTCSKWSGVIRHAQQCPKLNKLYSLAGPITVLYYIMIPWLFYFYLLFDCKHCHQYSSVSTERLRWLTFSFSFSLSLSWVASMWWSYILRSVTLESDERGSRIEYVFLFFSFCKLTNEFIFIFIFIFRQQTMSTRRARKGPNDDLSTSFGS